MGHTRYGKAKGRGHSGVQLQLACRFSRYLLCWWLVDYMVFDYIVYRPNLPDLAYLSTCPAPWLAAASLAG